MRLLALLLLLFSSMHSFSQECNNTLTGTLLDIHDGSKLSGATIIVTQTGAAVQTDLDGNFSVKFLCDSTYNLQVSHPSCTTKIFSLEVQSDVQKTFKLEHHLESLNEVIISGNKTYRETKTLFENTLNQETIASFSSGSLGDILNTISGVSSLNTGNTVVKPMINGLHSSRIVLINNGVQMQDQQWGAEHAPSIDVNTAGSIKVIKGAGALKYGGNAIGGVIISSAPKVALLDSLYGKTIISGATNGRGGTATSSLTKSYENGWYTSLQAAAKRFGDFNAPDYILSNTGVFERNMSARLGFNRIDYAVDAYYSYFKNEVGILRASHIGGAEDQVQAISNPIPSIIEDFTYTIGVPRQDVTHHLAIINAHKDIEGIGSFYLQYDYQQNNRLEFDIRRGDDKDKPSVDLVLKTQSLKVDFRSQAKDKFEYETGLIGAYQTNFANPLTGVRRLIPDYTKYDFGAYITGNYTLNSRWLFEAGLRVDHTYMDVYKFYRQSFWEERGYDTQFSDLVIQQSGNQILTNPKLNFTNPAFTLGFKHAFGSYMLFANYAIASRAPNPSELFSEGLHHSASRIEIGDLQFGSETAHKVSLTLQQRAENLDFTITPYSNTIDNYILIEPTGIRQTIRGNFQVWEYRQTKAQIFGVDLDASLTLRDNLSLLHQFSFLKGYDVSKKGSLINMPSVSTKNSLMYSNLKYNNLKVSLESHYVFAQNEFPDTNFEVVLQETTQTVDVSTPPPGYHLLNLNASFSVLQGLDIGLHVNNMLNTSYRNYLNRLRYYADDVGRNITLQLSFNY